MMHIKTNSQKLIYFESFNFWEKTSFDVLKWCLHFWKRERVEGWRTGGSLGGITHNVLYYSRTTVADVAECLFENS